MAPTTRLDRDALAKILGRQLDVVGALPAMAVTLAIFAIVQFAITGVLFFVADGKYAVSGAQPPEVLLQLPAAC